MEYINSAAEDLKKEFPNLFLEDKKYRNDIPKGWYTLVKELLAEISNVVKNDEQLKQDFFIIQMKEKLGGLRVYTSVRNKEINELISDASDKTYLLCAECGTTAKLMAKYNYILPMCEKCAKENGYSSFDERLFVRKNSILGEITDDI